MSLVAIFSTEGSSYEMQYYFDTNDVELHDVRGRVLLTFKPDSTVIEGIVGRMVGRFSLVRNCWCFHPFGSEIVYEYGMDLLQAEIKVSKMYIERLF